MSQRHYHTTIAAHSYRPVRETCALYTPANTTFARVSLLPACNSYVSHIEDEVVVGLRSQSMDSLNPHPPCPFVPGAPSRCRAFLPSSLHPLCHGILLPALLPYRVCPPHEPLQGRFSVSVRLHCASPPVSPSCRSSMLGDAPAVLLVVPRLLAVSCSIFNCCPACVLSPLFCCVVASWCPGASVRVINKQRPPVPLVRTAHAPVACACRCFASSIAKL